ncbi:MAG: PAC2 family protein [Desulfatiglandales bacterium]
MSEPVINIEYLPRLTDPLFIAGFEGWGNALDLSRGMVDYLIRKLDAQPFGRLNPDIFYRFDETRPTVEVKNGFLEVLKPPEGLLHVVQRGLSGRDIIILKAVEPHLRWAQFVDTLLSLCDKIGVKTIISLGSMYDNVLHTDRLVSALASSAALLDALKQKHVNPVNYHGPSAIHTTIHAEAQNRGFESISLWCHCPYYLQGTTHFGLLSHLGALLSSWGDFDLDISELENTWEELAKQIQGLIDKNPELQTMVNDIRKTKMKGSWDVSKKGDKVIHFEDFFKPK